MLVRPPSRTGWGFMWSPLAINLEYIAAYIANDVDEIRIVNQEFDDTDIKDHIREFEPDLFGVTMSATDHSSGLALCRTAKESGITTAIGGYHPTAIPDEMLGHSQVDLVFRGESELTMKELIAQGSPENVDGISYRDNGGIVHNAKRHLIEDLDSLPENICEGGSAIYSPLGEVIAGPLYGEEGILYAELDLAEIVQSHYDFDAVGHYSRPDILQLIVRETPQQTVVYEKMEKSELEASPGGQKKRFEEAKE